MDYETVSPEAFGASLTGIGLNILTRDVRGLSAQLVRVFGMTAHRVTDDFAIMSYGKDVFQLHADATYAENPLLGLVPENPPRGAGIEIRLYDTDPDSAHDLADAAGFTVLQPPTNKPHGLRECYLLCDDGYAWIPSRPL
ncbi:glyoxalase [Marivita sp. S0852]|uniref:glyoxalase n=1 Tax=Marivita sp. S0852 TaxID=3373893 RepID=UPI003981CB5A